MELAPPVDLAELQIAGVLGRGESATVYAASAGGVALALKVGHRPEHGRRLAQEGRMLLRAQHPAVPRLLGAGWVDASEGGELRPALALARVEGEPLVAQATSTELTVQLGAQLARAVDALHAGGVAHGDLKPENVVVSRGGALHVLDLGLAREAAERELEGATPRYLARGDRDLGDGRQRDLLALGLMLAELAEPTLRGSSELLRDARAASLPAPLGEVCAALLAPSPDARPRAGWVAERLASAASAPRGAPDDGDRRARLSSVQNAYARARARVLTVASASAPGACAWLEPLCAWGVALTRLEAPELGPAREPALPLSRDELSAWIVSVVGAPALSWPLAALAGKGEAQLGRALSELAWRQPSTTWTLGDLSRALDSDAGAPAPAGSRPPPADDAPGSSAARSSLVELAVSLARAPAPEASLRAIEADPGSPPELVVLAARGLRLKGEIGRALALMRRLESSGAPRWLAEAAELRRRGGDVARARELSERALAASPGEPVATACAARLTLDEGAPASAIARLGEPADALGLEVLALAHAQLGDLEAANAALDAAEATPLDSEQRARVLGARGYVLATRDPKTAHEAFRSAAEHAAACSALLEEATYATGAGATGVDLGFLEQSASFSERAVRIWEHLGRGPRAARAALNAAAAYATAGRLPEARAWAESALEHAARAGDARALAFARCTLFDTSEPGTAQSEEHARAALELLPWGDPDRLRACARALRGGLYDGRDCSQEDDVALLEGRAAGAAIGARMEWIAARAERSAPRFDRLLAATLALGDSPFEITARGTMLAAGLVAARGAGRGEVALKLAASLRAAAEQLLQRAGAAFAPSCRDVPWVRAALGEAAGADGLSAEQARRLEQLVRGLGADARLGDLLRGVLDALVAWTGVERGLLLLRGPDGRLIPKVGRNLAQKDLQGPQLELSMSLARRALEQLEPVVAVDAAFELPDLHASVHALRLRSVLAVPLVSHGDVVGVVYLDDRVRKGAFGERELAWVRTLATLAATMGARALSEAKLRRAASQAARRGRELERALAEREARLSAALSTLGEARARAGSCFEGVIGKSEAIERTIRMAERVAASAVPVLIIGESGSGKELFARAVHASSRRAREPFVSENCGAIPETLLESALFGHVRGAFTGAERARTGLFTAADGGTLFLDEIGELTLGMQTKLLRVLEDGLVRPLGTPRATKVDVRLIAATNRDLPRMVAEKRFREDLFYRLSVVPLRVPPLRERPDDIPFLVQHFLELHAAGRRIHVTRAAMDALERAEWPGNVRQLENEIRRALVMSDGAIDVEHLTISRRRESPELEDVGLDVRARVDRLEAELVREALSRTQFNQTRAAKLLGLSRFGLQKMMKRLNVAGRSS